MTMATILLRVLAQLLAVVVALASLPVCAALGLMDKWLGVVMTCGLVVWMSQLDAGELAEFEKFQKQRLAKYGIEI